MCICLCLCMCVCGDTEIVIRKESSLHVIRTEILFCRGILFVEKFHHLIRNVYV